MLLSCGIKQCELSEPLEIEGRVADLLPVSVCADWKEGIRGMCREFAMGENGLRSSLT